ncbi:MAG: hypothetical protein JWL77_567 [Chthonomonadaceae bacterium]|nr:hypothetical protein [Chthonomonadaceae bacterium]
MSGAAEYEDSENKSSLGEWREATISLAAFATARGGTVHFGIAPSGKRLGMTLGKNTLENLANDIRRNTDPPIYPSIQIDGEESSAVVHVAVEESPIKPVWAFGKPYKRVGRTNQSLEREETQRLVEATTGRTWDALPCSGLKIEHLSREAVEDFLKRAQLDSATPTVTVLENLRLVLSDGSLCNAAALLFASHPFRLLDSAYVKCARFLGDAPIDFLDEQTLEGTSISQLEGALAFVKRNTRQAIKITGKPEHERIPEYPDRAIREAITNAICHRNYAETGHVQIRIFDSGLEVWNPASLPHDLTIEQLYIAHHSRPRNRKLADAFHRAGLIEGWGTGTLRMLQACKEQGMTPPQFRFEMGAFIVRFESPLIVVEKPPISVRSLTERLIKTVQYVQENGSITNGEYQQLFGVSKRQATYDLAHLVSIQHLVVVRAGRSTRYTLP